MPIVVVQDYYDDIRQQQLRELGILNVDKKSNNKIRYSQAIVDYMRALKSIDH